MNNTVTIASYNCRGFKSSVEEIKSLCSHSDIVCLQETMLSNIDLPLLNQVHKDFFAKGLSAMDMEDGVLSGRPHGGLAILWRKSLTTSFKTVDMGDNRLLGLEVYFGSKKLLFINVYLPWCTTKHLDEFLHYLSQIDAFISTADTPYVYTLGDFNADPCMDTEGHISHLFGRELFHFCQKESLIISDFEHLANSDTFTCLSDSHKTTSWLDHLVCTASAHALVNSVSVQYGTVTSDHCPLSISIDLPEGCELQPPPPEGNALPACRIQWDNLTPEDIACYKQHSKDTLSAIAFNHDLAWCSHVHCQDTVIHL